MAEACDALVIGGGFYGLFLAEFLASHFAHVVLCERESSLMQRASYSNQARVHNGYHYPRSVLTASRSRVNFPRFVSEFTDAVDASFEKVYAIGRRFSKVTAEQFETSMKRIGAPIHAAPNEIAALFDPAYIEAAFVVREHAFNAVVLGAIMRDRVRNAGVDMRLSTAVRAVHSAGKAGLRVELATSEVQARHVFCCGYSHLNAPAAASGLPVIPLKHELAEMALVDVPLSLRQLGVTVMDGPFFSLMPFPARGLHTLSHVRYTPHAHWFDGDAPYRSAYEIAARFEKRTAFPHMIRDAARYLPGAAQCEYRDSLWEVKTVLPRSESDDSRPILFKPNFGLPGYHLVMGGKIDNIYDVIEVIRVMFTEAHSARSGYAI